MDKTPEQFSFRLLNTGFHNCYYNMGLDEALLEGVSAGGKPVLRFYGWNPPAVSVGYFQGLTEEVDLDACKRLGFDVVRRISGGGAVFHKSELTYSIIMGLDHPLARAPLEESYRTICEGIILGLKELGAGGVFSGINDILTGGRKISGNAQTRRLKSLLQHGTILLDNDVDLMFKVLRVPREKTRGTLAQEVSARVTSLRSVLDREVSFEETAAALGRGFAQALGLDYEESGVLPQEEIRARTLAAEKFSTTEWLFKR
ncbi:MAG: lipoate--protein ligase family protein [Spirochaetaceae bacterium]|jgi:lipoate-protein ligase A|nr:lipoate--protein ligase family protein [Spirochaetaceae bacterium]